MSIEYLCPVVEENGPMCKKVAQFLIANVVVCEECAKKVGIKFLIDGVTGGVVALPQNLY